jgi:hypothetical protein
MGVGEDFSKFKDAYNIAADKMASISYRYRRITKQLNVDFWSTDSETAHSLYVGSYGRDTAATGVSDLDVGFILPVALYHQFTAYQTNGQSALLQRVKTSIQRTYSTSESFGDGQVVVITFTDGIKFEILPVFENQDGSSWTYPNANLGGIWKTCNPRAEMAAVAVRSRATNRNLKYLGRMTRIWRDYTSVPMSGMLIDTLAYQFIESYEFREKSFYYHDFMARDFFLYLSERDKSQTIWRAPGSGSAVTRNGSFERKAREAYELSLLAIQYNDDSYAWSRRQKWREIFGPLFPNS